MTVIMIIANMLPTLLVGGTILAITVSFWVLEILGRRKKSRKIARVHFELKYKVIEVLEDIIESKAVNPEYKKEVSNIHGKLSDYFNDVEKLNVIIPSDGDKV